MEQSSLDKLKFPSEIVDVRHLPGMLIVATKTRYYLVEEIEGKICKKMIKKELYEDYRRLCNHLLRMRRFKYYC